jgi:hypothetical protein
MELAFKMFSGQIRSLLDEMSEEDLTANINGMLGVLNQLRDYDKPTIPDRTDAAGNTDGIDG